MVRRVTTYDSGTGIGQGLAALADAFAPDPAEQTALASAQLHALQGNDLAERTYNRNQVANVIGKLSGVDPNDPASFQPFTAELYSRAIRAGMNPEYASNALLGYLSNTGAPDANIGRAFVGSGRGLNVNEGVSLGDRERIRAANAANSLGERLASRDPQIVTAQDNVPRFVATGQPVFPTADTIREGYNYGPPAAGAPGAAPGSVPTGPAAIIIPQGVPRGVSIGFDNNNPGNLRPGALWEGAVGSMTHPDAGAFVQFDTPVSGIRAMTLNLLTQGRTASTPRALLNRLAPSNDPADRLGVNRPDAYAAMVARALGIGIDDPINFSDPATMGRLVNTIITMENGSNPYGPEILDAGIRRAFAAAGRAGAPGQVAGAAGAPVPQGAPARASPLRTAITGANEPAPTPAAQPAGAAPVPGGPNDPASPMNRVRGEEQLRTEFNQNPTARQYLVVARTYRTMLEAAGRNTRASDLNLVYGTATIFDPQASVVREGEQSAVRATGTLPDYLQTAISQINGGSGLTPETRRALVAELTSRVGPLEQQFAQLRDQYIRQAEANGWRPGQVVGDFAPVVRPNGDPVAPPAPARATSAPVDAIPTVATPEEAARLPPGTRFRDPEGNIRVRP